MQRSDLLSGVCGPTLRYAVLISVAVGLGLCPAAEAIRINFSYSDRDPHPSDPDGSMLIAITRAAADYYESILQQRGPHNETTFSFNLRWEDLGTGPGTPLGQYRFGVPFQTDRLALNSNTNWFFDPNPLDHSEFNLSQTLYRDLSPSEQNDWFNGNPPDVLEVGFGGTAVAGGPAAGLFDLFTVVLHEIGHALGVRSPTFGSRSQYPFPDYLIGGLDVAARTPDGDSGHLAAEPAVMFPSTSPSRRTLPSTTDLLAMANRINIQSAGLPGQFNPVVTDLHRVDFIGTQSGNGWDDPLNWIGGRVPDGEQDIFVRHGGSAFRIGQMRIGGLSPGTLTVSNGSFLSNAGEIRVGNFGAGTMTIADGGVVLSDGGAITFGSGATGAVTVTGAGSNWINSESLLVAQFGSGALTVQAAGRVTSAGGRIAVNAGSTGNATVTGSGSRWTSNGPLTVGELGAGTLTIGSGGRASSSSGILGDRSGSTGLATVAGSGSIWTISENLSVGRFGQGTLRIQAGGRVDVGGTLLINASSSVLLNGGTLRLDGFDRTGNFNFPAGTVEFIGDRVVGTDLAIAEIFGASPIITSGKELTIEGVADIETLLTVTAGTFTARSRASVGASGEGQLAIQTAGTVSTDLATIGHAAGSHGTATVTSAGSIWTSGSLDVGRAGDGTLVIQNGGRVSNTVASVARQSGSTGTVTVTGSGSTWTSSGDLTVSGARLGTSGGTGMLNIENSGRVSNENGTIGGGTGGSGTVAVVGTGSRWTSNGTLTVGSFGIGTLDIRDGGHVTNTHATIAAASGVFGTSVVTVAGAGSRWITDGTLTVAGRAGGRFGGGRLEVLDGGNVTSTSGIIARFTGSEGTVRVSGGNTIWTIDGPLSVGGDPDFGNGGSGRIEIAPGGQVEVADEVVLFPGGVVRLEGGALAARTIRFQGGGQLQWPAGTLHVDTFHGDLVNAGGTLAPGRSAGTTTVTGDYTQQVDGALQIELGGTAPGTEHDRLHIDGHLAAEGILAVRLIDGFVPQPDESFGVMRFGSRSGDMEIVNQTGLAGLTFDPIYTSTALTLLAGALFPGDANLDGRVDGEDFLVWQAGFGAQVGAEWTDGDFNGDGRVDGEDFLIWQAHFGSAIASSAIAPEPASALLVCLGILLRRRCGNSGPGDCG